MEKSQYRVVTSGKIGRLHKTYFKTHTAALQYFNRVAKRYNNAELQELEHGSYLTVEYARGF